MHPNLLALGAIALWSSVATLGVELRHVPPFLLTGLALVVGSIPSWPLVRQWRVRPAVLALGVYGLFGFHFLLFVALRLAPPVEANLVNYLWPLLIVVLAPAILPGTPLRARHVAGAVMGFAGAAIAILGSGREGGMQGWSWGYLPALGSAVIWSTYSLMTKRLGDFPTAAIGLFGIVSGLLSLACHAVLEPAVDLSARDLALVALMGLGPLGAAFFLWDAALKRGDARQIGVLSYLTPLASTALLLLVTGRVPGWSIALATLLIIGGAVLGTLAPRARAAA